VVIAIISLLVSIMVPSLDRVRELARRAKCAANLRSSGSAMVLYAESEGSYPYVPLNGAGWGVAVGTGREINPFAGAAQSRNPTSTLYLLVRGVYCGGAIFVCPSAEEREDDSQSADRWDFTSGANVSHALMNPYGSSRQLRESSGQVVLMADASPYFAAGTGLRNATAVVDFGANPDEAAVARGNSPNHRGEGQNVARYGGSAEFRSRADCGAGNDNIYTRAANASGTDPGGNLPAAGADGSQYDQGPAGPEDSYLLP